ncbi:MAG: DUF2723 domain-containing protein [Anaerolineae bacterium]|nr:DUF2723 domain-containing protein [Anaerolineae bacterium]
MKYTHYSHYTPAWIIPGFLLILTGLLYLPFCSISLDDFDAYSFVLALEHFNLDLQQPHPPGFPVYIGLGKLFLAMTRGNAVKALTLFSALSGMVNSVLTYALGRVLDPERPLTGIVAALWGALLPVNWLTSEKALSDIPGLMMILLALWLWWRWDNHLKTPRKLPAWKTITRLIGIGLFSGLALGVRPQNALPLLLTAGYIFITRWLRLRRVEWEWWIIGVGGLLGILSWLIPVTIAVGGLTAYWDAIRTHALHVGQADALGGMGLPLWVALRTRGWAFANTFLIAALGLELAPPWTPPEILCCFSAAVITGLGIIRAGWQRRESWLLAVWMAAVTGQVLLFETLDRPRLLLPLFPPLLLLVARGWARILLPRRQRTLIVTGFSLVLMTFSAPLVAQLSAVPAPPAQATAYIAAHYPPESTLVAAAGSFRAVQVELPAYRLAYLYQFNPAGVQATLAGEIRYVVIFDRDQFPSDVLEILSVSGDYVPLEERTFVRDRRVHTQHDQVRVQVLTPAVMIPPEALRLPEDGCIDIGDENDGRYLSQGWFRPEDIGGARGRWAGQTLTSTLRVKLEAGQDDHADADIRIHLKLLAYPAEQTLTLYAGEQLLERVSLLQGWQEIVIILPPDVVQSDTITTLHLGHARVLSPFEVTGGESSDRRALAAAYDWVCFEQP